MSENPKPVGGGPLEAGRTVKPKSNLEGHLLKDRYAITRQLGHGGFGATYLANDTQLHSRPVVLKILLDHQLQHPWALKKFRQEMEVLARIDHPGIVGALDSGELPNG